MMLFERVEERDSGADKYGYYTAAHPSILVAPKKKKKVESLPLLISSFPKLAN